MTRMIEAHNIGGLVVAFMIFFAALLWMPSAEAPESTLAEQQKSEACYFGLNEDGKSVYHVRGFSFAIIIAKSLSWTKSPKGSVTEVQDEPLDWSKYGNCNCAN